jgi:class 3 adenylate cyclase/tetratricopeptide (TPR) repeat protein
MAEARKVVTVVFADVAGSTALGEALDPEAVRRLMERYFRDARSVLEQHGGKVEKFIGDAVMAVFGIPLLHDDDALRAVRAAIELQGRLTVLNEELERDWGVQIAVRTGINTGEVVAGDGAATEAFATGDAVNVAARLEQAAGPGEILIGEATRRLLEEAIRVEAVEPLTLKGKAEPVRAWRLLEVLPDVPAFTRPIRAPFIGREAELAELEDAFARAVEERSCCLVTVLGPPGIGKSRLARELLAVVGKRARVVVGRCVSYGDGITYWPLAEIVQQVSGRDSAGITELVADDDSAELIVERIAGAVGIAEAEGRSEEIAWAVRKLFEALSRESPLVVVLDDVHWAEPTFLDLIEYLAGFTAGPVLLLALARPDLLDERASWTVPRPNARIISLEPLSEGEAETLIDKVGSGTVLTESARRRIAEASEGNPLFVEQLLAFQAEDGGADNKLVVPPTIQALLAARIDRLGPGARAVIERASVEGRSFHRGAVSALLPEGARASVAGDLMSLVRRELIRPDRAEFAGDDGFRFVHALVQDAAYASMAKELRAELHERYAGWLESAAGSRMGEYEEILGYHLEQAYRYRAELGPLDELARALGRQAAERLATAAERALTRGDVPARVNLLTRAASLVPADDRLRSELLPELGMSLTWLGEFARAEAVLSDAIDGAVRVGDRRADARACIALLDLRFSTQPGVSVELRQEVERVVNVLEEVGDELGLARAWYLIAMLRWGQGQGAAAQEGWERSMEYARRAGSRREELDALAWLGSAALYGPTPGEAARQRCEDILARVKGVKWAEAQLLRALGCFRAFEGRFDEARTLLARNAAILEELGFEVVAAWTSLNDGWVEMLAGDADAAERALRPAYETLAGMGAKAELQVVGDYLAQALCMQGRYEEAEHLALSVEQLDPTAILEVASARGSRARSRARLGRPEEAERLAREAVTLVEQTDFPIDRAEARMSLAEVLRLGGRFEEAADLVDEALRLYEQKGNLVSAERARALLTELGR